MQRRILGSESNVVEVPRLVVFGGNDQVQRFPWQIWFIDIILILSRVKRFKSLQHISFGPVGAPPYCPAWWSLTFNYGQPA
jgi:uncharacterized membrane protein YecN with MAPEG domain